MYKCQNHTEIFQKVQMTVKKLEAPRQREKMKTAVSHTIHSSFLTMFSVLTSFAIEHVTNNDASLNVNFRSRVRDDCR